MNHIKLENLFQLQNTFVNSGIILAYNGPLNQQGIIEIGSVLRSSLQTEEIVFRVMKRIFSVFIEQAQNIMKYSATRIQDAAGIKGGEGMITILRKDNFFYLVSGNYVAREDVEPIETRLKYITSLSPEELKKFDHDLKFKSEKLSGTASAGLGFVEMARKADKPLDWFFEPVSAEYSFFCLSIAIKLYN